MIADQTEELVTEKDFDQRVTRELRNCAADIIDPC